MSFVDNKENVYRSRPADNVGAANTWDKMVSSGVVTSAVLVRCIPGGLLSTNCSRCIKIHGLSNRCPICGSLVDRASNFGYNQAMCSCGATLAMCIFGGGLDDYVVSGVAMRLDHIKEDTI